MSEVPEKEVYLSQIITTSSKVNGLKERILSLETDGNGWETQIDSKDELMFRQNFFGEQYELRIKWQPNKSLTEIDYCHKPTSIQSNKGWAYDLIIQSFTVKPRAKDFFKTGVLADAIRIVELFMDYNENVVNRVLVNLYKQKDFLSKTIIERKELLKK